jgi:ribosomal protein S27E
MGEQYRIRCKKCNYSYTVDIGHGMDACGFFEPSCWDERPCYYSYFEEPHIIHDIEDLLAKYGSALSEDFTAPATKEWNGHGRFLYVCPKCQKLHTKFAFKLVHPDGEYVPEYKCDSCDTGLKRIQIEIPVDRDDVLGFKYDNSENFELKCPICGHDKFVRPSGTFLYD